MAKLELALLVGDESKRFLAELTKQIDRLEGLSVRAPKAEETEEDDSDDEEEMPVKSSKKKKPANGFDDDEDDEEEAKSDVEESDEDLEEDEDDEDEEEEKPKKKGKKLTLDDVNDACKAKASSIGGKEGRKTVLAILKKKFKTETVSDLEPDQYEACIKAMA